MLRLLPVLRLLRDHVTYVIFLAVTIFFAVVAPNFASFATAGAILRITAIVSVIATRHDFRHHLRRDRPFGRIGRELLRHDPRLAAGCRPALLARRHPDAGDGGGDRRGQRAAGDAAEIPSFLVTLGMLSVFSGAALTVTNTMPVPIVENGINNVLWNGSLFTIAGAGMVDAAGRAAGLLPCSTSRCLGRRVLAVGGNAVAASFSGIYVNRTEGLGFRIERQRRGVGRMMLAARSTAGNPSLGDGLELDVIAAVIIGRHQPVLAAMALSSAR